MAILVPNNPIAQRVWEEVSPATRGWPEANTNQMIRFIEAWTHVAMRIEQYVRDDSFGPGYSSVLDPSRAPSMFLDWLAQLTGQRGVFGEPDDVKRSRINGMHGLQRGSAAAIKAAPVPYLTGGRTVILTERVGGSPYRFSVVTYTDETPDPDAVLRALKEQKPAGQVMLYDTIEGGTFNDLYLTHPDFQDVYTTFTDFQEVLDDTDKQ